MDFKFNEKKAFTIIKKAEKVLIYKSENGYFVSDGVLIFRTVNRTALQECGLVDFDGEVREQSEIVRDCMNVSSSELDTIKFTPLLYKTRNVESVVLKYKNTAVLVDRKYIDLFVSPQLEFLSQSVVGRIYIFDQSHSTSPVAMVLPRYGEVCGMCIEEWLCDLCSKS